VDPWKTAILGVFEGGGNLKPGIKFGFLQKVAFFGLFWAKKPLFLIPDPENLQKTPGHFGVF
jgi:hypothetical protein